MVKEEISYSTSVSCGNTVMKAIEMQRGWLKQKSIATNLIHASMDVWMAGYWYRKRPVY